MTLVLVVNMMISESVILWLYEGSVYLRTRMLHMSTTSLAENEKRNILIKTGFTGKYLTHRRMVWSGFIFIFMEDRG